LAETSSRPRRALVLVGLVGVLFGGACTAPIRNEAAPRCDKLDTLVLLAQSVPSAELLPCIGNVPAGWTFGEMDIGTGDSTFTLDNSDAGIAAVRVRLSARCSTAGATEVASDESDEILQRQPRQFERVELLVGHFRATRSYVFGGGCVTYRFSWSGEAGKLVNEASLALDFRTRKFVADEVRRTSGGRLELQ
jgi:hypothetical protein